MSMNEWIIVDLEKFDSAHTTTTGLMVMDHDFFSDCEFPNIHTQINRLKHLFTKENTGFISEKKPLLRKSIQSINNDDRVFVNGNNICYVIDWLKFCVCDQTKLAKE